METATPVTGTQRPPIVAAPADTSMKKSYRVLPISSVHNDIDRAAPAPLVFQSGLKKLLEHAGLLFIGLVAGVIVAALWSLAWIAHGPSAAPNASAGQVADVRQSTDDVTTIVTSAQAAATNSVGDIAPSARATATPQSATSKPTEPATALSSPSATDTHLASSLEDPGATPSSNLTDEPVSSVLRPQTAVAAADTAQEPAATASPTAADQPSTSQATARSDTSAYTEPAETSVKPVAIAIAELQAPALAAEPIAANSGVSEVASTDTLLPGALAPWAQGSDSQLQAESGELTPIGVAPLSTDTAFCRTDIIAVFGSAGAEAQTASQTATLAISRGLQTASRIAALAIKCPDTNAIDRPMFVIASATALSSIGSETLQENMVVGWSAERRDADAIAASLRTHLGSETDANAFSSCAVLRVDSRNNPAPVSAAELERAFC